ncbi:hypothetical protein O181_102364 [Austropuccinia psidii MF-1]|uniref:Uncharacterized protein n=1 Tax=Austropuccinia psidii MF-1 TaxID=1389203 RepID=A0A9Q3JIC5_9BASI|nr:hypothetical protein [Austropuccinia psidii MF-1]
MPFKKKGKEHKREIAGKHQGEEGKCEWLAYSQRIYMLQHLCGTLIGPHGTTLALVGLDCSMSCGNQQASQRCVPNKAPWALGTILDSKDLGFKWQEAVSDILSASKKSDPSTARE